MVIVFENVSKVLKKANVYLDGKVTSRTIFLQDGKRVTLGIMLPGEYEFSTKDKEKMEVISGNAEVLLPGEGNWRSVGDGDVFCIPENSSFKIRVKELFDYCCYYG
ncbi:MAG: pyrimidine/purine nucleoside phosphorylase [Synergistetes bacterium]|nr:pyrimidine/purine nucleoside phosphorylase [Synergistota bacterium]